MQDWADRTQAVINGVSIIKNGNFKLENFPANVADLAGAINQIGWGLRCNRGEICQIIGKVAETSGRIDEKTREIMDKIERASVSYHTLRTVWSGGDPLQAISSLGQVAANLGFIVSNGKLQLAGEKISLQADVAASLVAEFKTWEPVAAPDSPLCWQKPCDRLCATPPSNPICAFTDDGKMAPNCIRGRECFCLQEPAHKLCTRNPESAYCVANSGDPSCIRGAEADKIARTGQATPGWISPVLNPVTIPLPEDQQLAWDIKQKKGASDDNDNSNEANDEATGQKVIDARPDPVSAERGLPICPRQARLSYRSVNLIQKALCIDIRTRREVQPASYQCPGGALYDPRTKKCSWAKGWRPPAPPGSEQRQLDDDDNSD